MLPFGTSDLVRLPDNPRSGIEMFDKQVTLVFDSVVSSNIKEYVLQKLNNSRNRYYPDVGGILVGYTSVKVKFKDNGQSEIDRPRIVDIKANFYIFRPQAGTQLTCIVSSKIDGGKFVYLAHGIFNVEILNLDDCCEDDIFVGQSILVEVEAVEHLAWNDPRILATFLEVADPGGSLIDLVDNFESDENEDLVNLNASKSSKKRRRKSISSSEKKKRRKRNVEDLQRSDHPAWPKINSPLIGNQNQTEFPVLSSCSSKTVGKPLNTIPASGLETEEISKVDTVVKIPIDVPTEVSESSSGDLQDSVSNPMPNCVSEKVSSMVQDSNELYSENAKSRYITDSVDPNIQQIEVSAVGTLSSTEDRDEKPASSSKKIKSEAPPGFDDLSTINEETKKKRVKLMAPDGKFFSSFKRAWEYVDKYVDNPNYLDSGNDHVDPSNQEENPSTGNASSHGMLKLRRQHSDNVQNTNGVSESISSAAEQQDANESKSCPTTIRKSKRKKGKKGLNETLEAMQETSVDPESQSLLASQHFPYSNSSPPSESLIDENAVSKGSLKKVSNKSTSVVGATDDEAKRAEVSGYSSYDSDSPAETSLLAAEIPTPKLNINEETGEDDSSSESSDSDESGGRKDKFSKESLAVNEERNEPLKKSKMDEDNNNGSSSPSSDSEDYSSKISTETSKAVKKAETKQDESVPVMTNELVKNLKEERIGLSEDSSSTSSSVIPVSKGANNKPFDSEKGDAVKKFKTPQLSSTVIESGKEYLVAVPEGISPIISKTKILSKQLNYFDKIISKPNSGFPKSDSQPESSPSSRAPKKKKSKKRKRVDGFM